MPKKIGNPPCYSSWRKLVLIRDKYKCQVCGKKGIVVHHIKDYKDYPELRVVISNGVILCIKCDKKLHTLLSYLKLLRKRNLLELLILPLVK